MVDALKKEIASAVLDAGTFLRNAERAIYWLEQLETNGKTDDGRVLALRKICADVYRASAQLDDVYPRPGKPHYNPVPSEHELTEEEKKDGGYFNSDGFYVFKKLEVAGEDSDGWPVYEVTDEDFEREQLSGDILSTIPDHPF